MTYEQAQEKSFTVKWKTTECPTRDCWCRIIEPEDPIVYEEDEEYYIIGSGGVDKESAEYIVLLHNEAIRNMQINNQ